MKQALASIARTVPGLLEHSTFQICLQGWPAAAAVFFVGATIVATTMVLRSDGHAEPEE